MIRTLLIDDEEPARDRLSSMLDGFDDVDVVGQARDGVEAVEQIGRERPDLIFLDIQMPGMTGMEVAASLPPPRPRIIFCTAFDQYAIDAFEQNAADYLLKPVSKARLTRALARVRDSMRKQELHTREVADATAAQARLFPQSLPPMESLDYTGICRAARGVGGDYYDFLALGPGRLGIALGDVSGKGLFAGLLMANLQARIQSIAPGYGSDVGRLMHEINQLMLASTDSNRYATLFYGLYDDATRRLRYANAGHNPPLIFRHNAGSDYTVERLEANGTVVGLLPEAAYGVAEVQLDGGDILAIFTDGLTEAMNPSQEEFGEAALQELIRAHGSLGPEELREKILDTVGAFVSDAPQHDDLTLIVAKVRERR